MLHPKLIHFLRSYFGWQSLVNNFAYLYMMCVLGNSITHISFKFSNTQLPIGRFRWQIFLPILLNIMHND
jgi:hypothetical protein